MCIVTNKYIDKCVIENYRLFATVIDYLTSTYAFHLLAFSMFFDKFQNSHKKRTIDYRYTRLINCHTLIIFMLHNSIGFKSALLSGLSVCHKIVYRIEHVP